MCVCECVGVGVWVCGCVCGCGCVRKGLTLFAEFSIVSCAKLALFSPLHFLFTYRNLLGNAGHAAQITEHVPPHQFPPHFTPLCSTRTHHNEETQDLLLCQPT